MIRFSEDGILLGCNVIQSIVDAALWVGTEAAAASTAAATATTTGLEAAGVGAETAGVVGGVAGQLALPAATAAVGAGVGALAGNPAMGAEIGAGVGGGLNVAGGVIAPTAGAAVPGAGTASAMGTAAPAGTASADPALVSTGGGISGSAANVVGPPAVPSPFTSVEPGVSNIAPGAQLSSTPTDVATGATAGGGAATSTLQGSPPLTPAAPPAATTPTAPAASPPVTGTTYGPTGAVDASGNPVMGPTGTTQLGISQDQATSLITGEGHIPGSTTEAQIGGSGFNFDTAMKYAPAGMAGMGLVGDFIMSNKQPPGYAALASEARSSQLQGSQLESYAMTGTLPPGTQQALETAAGNAATAIRANYAKSGESGSSAEAQDLANLQLRVQQQGADIAQRLLSQGIQQTQLSESIYSELMQTSIQQDQMLSQGIGNFATALASMGRPIYQLAA